MFIIKCVVCLCVIWTMSFVLGERVELECASRRFRNRSTVCVCNSTYCDTITREQPFKEQYFAYTSSEAGLRFQKSTYYMLTYEPESICLYTLDIDTSKTYQIIEGFGAGVTDSAAMNWAGLKDPVMKQSMIDSYFSGSGLQYSMLRVPIGGTGFSTHPYAYNELPKDDAGLTNYTLASEDLHLKIPLIQACEKASNIDLHIIATTWSPPAWMKDNRRISGYSRLKKEFYQSYSDYHCKFIEKYKQHNITIWGITTTNEPLNGLLNLNKANSLGWSIKGMGEWIQDNLGPTMRKHHPEIKIIGVDDRRFTVPLWFKTLLLEYPNALKYLDGVAVHSYDNITPSSSLKNALEPYPDKFVITTEASEGSRTNIPVDLGSWERAENYAINIIEDLNNGVIGWLDSNLCLNMQGGPSWARQFADSAVIVNLRKKEFYKQPMFYIMGHFSKFVPRGSKRVAVTERFNCGQSLNHVAFLTPDDTVVVVIYNSGEERPMTIKLKEAQALLLMGARSITTVEFLNDGTARTIFETSEEEQFEDDVSTSSPIDASDCAVKTE